MRVTFLFTFRENMLRIRQFIFQVPFSFGNLGKSGPDLLFRKTEVRKPKEKNSQLTDGTSHT